MKIEDYKHVKIKSYWICNGTNLDESNPTGMDSIKEVEFISHGDFNGNDHLVIYELQLSI